MNGKYRTSSSLEGQLAAVAMAVVNKIQSRINRAGDSEIPSASDFEEAFRVHVKIAELQTRLNERDRLEEGHADRRSELVQQLYRLKAEIPEEFRS
jgi:hypothetical protein